MAFNSFGPPSLDSFIGESSGSSAPLGDKREKGDTDVLRYNRSKDQLLYTPPHKLQHSFLSHTPRESPLLIEKPKAVAISDYSLYFGFDLLWRMKPFFDPDVVEIRHPGLPEDFPVALKGTSRAALAPSISRLTGLDLQPGGKSASGRCSPGVYSSGTPLSEGKLTMPLIIPHDKRCRAQALAAGLPAPLKQEYSPHSCGSPGADSLSHVTADSLTMGPGGRDWKRGCRIGEAGHPGPPQAVLVHKPPPGSQPGTVAGAPSLLPKSSSSVNSSNVSNGTSGAKTAKSTMTNGYQGKNKAAVAARDSTNSTLSSVTQGSSGTRQSKNTKQTVASAVAGMQQAQGTADAKKEKQQEKEVQAKEAADAAAKAEKLAKRAAQQATLGLLPATVRIRPNGMRDTERTGFGWSGETANLGGFLPGTLPSAALHLRFCDLPLADQDEISDKLGISDRVENLWTYLHRAFHLLSLICFMISPSYTIGPAICVWCLGKFIFKPEFIAAGLTLILCHAGLAPYFARFLVGLLVLVYWYMKYVWWLVPKADWTVVLLYAPGVPTVLVDDARPQHHRTSALDTDGFAAPVRRTARIYSDRIKEGDRISDADRSYGYKAVELSSISVSTTLAAQVFQQMTVAGNNMTLMRMHFGSLFYSTNVNIDALSSVHRDTREYLLAATDERRSGTHFRFSRVFTAIQSNSESK